MARQYYKDSTTGQMKPLGVKVEDTLPVDTIVDYDGQDIPEGWVEIPSKVDYISDLIITDNNYQFNTNTSVLQQAVKNTDNLVVLNLNIITKNNVTSSTATNLISLPSGLVINKYVSLISNKGNAFINPQGYIRFNLNGSANADEEIIIKGFYYM